MKNIKNYNTITIKIKSTTTTSFTTATIDYFKFDNGYLKIGMFLVRCYWDFFIVKS